jgi:hypothetical protein
MFDPDFWIYAVVIAVFTVFVFVCLPSGSGHVSVLDAVIIFYLLNRSESKQ